MRIFILLMIISILLVSCNSAPQPQIMDNGKTGQITVNIFYDSNRNGVMDQGESGLSEEVSISQEISCPPTNLQNLTRATTDANGKTVFRDLKPGFYCIAYMGSKGLTTKMTDKVPVSSKQDVMVIFGLREE